MHIFFLSLNNASSFKFSHLIKAYVDFCINILLKILYYDLDVKNMSEEMEITPLSLHRENRIGKILMCFSVYTNTKIIFSTKLDANAIPTIHGLKFLSMSWIVLLHTIFFMLNYVGE